MTAEKSLTMPSLMIGRWAETGDLTQLSALADWYGDHHRQPKLAALIRRLDANPEWNDAVLFFFKEAGSSYEPDCEEMCEGQLRGAFVLAAAERWLRKSQFVATWIQDIDYDPNDYDGPMPDIGWGCVLMEHGSSNTDASLWGITFDGDGFPVGKPYKRVVEAELAMELMPDE